MSFQPKKFLRRGIERLKAYVPGRGIEEVATEFGLSEVTKLASNENALGPSPRAVEAIQKILNGLHRYPEGGANALRECLGEKLGVAPEEIIVGNGGDDVLSVLARTFLNDGDEAIIPQPTFSPYAHVTLIMGGKVVPSPLRDFGVDLQDVRSKINKQTKLIFLCSPNNPTGTIITEGELDSFLADLPDQILVLLDEAYGDFVNDPNWPNSLTRFRQNPLIVLRSFSKIYGLAGLRVGYGIGSREFIQYMNRVREPFNVNQLAQVAAMAALDDEEFRNRTIRTIQEERQRLYEAFERMGYSYLKSQANFIFVRVGDGDEMMGKLMQKGLSVRPGSAFGCPDWIRITVGLPEENRRLLRALE
jgi:histidinol-phosphate aminotransferase